MKRRDFSQGSAVMALAAGAGWLPAVSWAQANATGWSKAAFDAKNVADAVKAMGGSAAAAQSNEVQLTAPEIAENGNVVRIGVATTNPAVTQIALLVEKNPNAVAAVFDVIPGTEANFATNIKMGQSSNVLAVAKAGDKFLFVSKEVKVTLGGCGG
jgi:sulfur-oxidizing protein SoxY